MGQVIYKICRRSDWARAQQTGKLDMSADDRRDGYLHLCTAEQLAATAAKHFAGGRDLVLLAIRADRLGPALKWEKSRGGALYPHLHGELAAGDVLWAQPLPLDESGRHLLPAELAS
jgi:uncharacterized protein (DUF952 family)